MQKAHKRQPHDSHAGHRKRPKQHLPNGQSNAMSIARPAIHVRKHPPTLGHASTASSATTLPVYTHRQEILDALRTHQTVVIVGETGSGKSTQLPRILFEAGFGSVVCTQPRRVAATTIARRVSEEMSATLGGLVGYSIRFDECTSADTRIKYATDGVLLRECMTDKTLSRYQVVLLDEAHERSLQTDILAGLIRQLQDTRRDLRVVVMSATLDTDVFMSFFRDTAFVAVKGRQHAVDVFYCAEPQVDFIDAALVTALQIHEEEPTGDILIFLPGQEEIEALVQLLADHLRKLTHNLNYLICPIYAALPAEEQLRVFEPTPANTRKFVCATNIAETSVTISGIRYVIDPGLAKMRYYHSGSGMEALKVLPIAQAQAWQRTGRAGREGPGKCFRLYTEPSFETLDPVALPEIQRVNIAQVVLQLKVMGIDRPHDFRFISAPHMDTITRALELLFALGALGEDGQLTTHGRQMASLPLDPMFAHLLISSNKFGCIKEALTAVAMISAENVFFHPSREDEKAIAVQAHRQLAVHDGDLPTLVHIYDMWLQAKRSVQWCKSSYVNYRALMHAFDVRAQLARLMESLGYDTTLSCGPENDRFLRAICAGLFMQVVRRKPPSEGKKGHYALVLGNGAISTNAEIYVHPSSTLHGRNPAPAYLVFTELVETSRKYMRTLTAVQGTWLPEVAPHLFQKATTAASR